MTKKEQIGQFLITVFGNSPKTRFKRILITLIIVLIAVMMLLNLSCKIDIGPVHLEWNPAADIKINKEL